MPTSKLRLEKINRNTILGTKKRIKKIDAPKDDGKTPSNLVATVMIADIKYCHPVVKVVHDHLDNAFELISLC